MHQTYLKQKGLALSEQREHRSMLRRRGFTLIELLVTVGIIVILATLIIVNIAQARMSGRDAKRIADVASIQLALEMYKNAKGVYPFPLDTTPAYTYANWAAAVGGTPTPTEQTNWNLLGGSSSTTDKGLQPYLSPLPKDPLNKPGYRYYIKIVDDGAATPIRTGAIIKTKLEANEEKMTDDSCPPSNATYYDVISGFMTATQKTTFCDEAPPAT